MSARSSQFCTGTLIALALGAIAACWMIGPRAIAIAQTPLEGEAAPPPAPAAAPTPFRHRIVVEDADVEPAHTRLKLKEDAWVYTRPARSSKHVARVHAGKFVNVTGSTHYYLRVELKGGRVGYLSPSAVELVTPTDKLFTLTSDSPVYEQPNRWAKRVSEVHKGHSVHVVGLSLDYMKIKMKSGNEGFIPVGALE